MDEVLIYFIDTNKYSVLDLKKAFVLSDLDLKKLDSINNEKIYKEKYISLYFKRRFAGDFTINEYEKPVSKKIFFNVSHSHGLVAVALCKNREIGFDIELVRPYKKEMEQYISNKKDIKSIIDDRSFFKLWTNKESLVKCDGLGIRCEVKNVPGLPLDGQKEFLNNSYYSKSFSYLDYECSISLKGKDDFIYEINII